MQIYADVFVKTVWKLGVIIADVQEKNIWEDEEYRTHLVLVLKELKEVCTRSELPVSLVLVDTLLYPFDLFESSSNQGLREIVPRYNTMDLLAHQLDSLRIRFADELSTKLFLQVPYSRKSYFDAPLAGWELIIKRFEGCSRDVEEMNKCFALSRYSAAMFHALHVAEWGAIILGECIGVSDPKKGWGPTQRKLEELVKAGHTNLPNGFPVTFQFLEQVNREIDSMVLAWRNKIDHAANSLAILPNTDFTPDMTEHIMHSVKVFMTWLMENMK